MTVTVDLLTGVAELLDAAGAGTWSPTAAVADPATAITLIRLPQTPTRVICLTPYEVANDPHLSDAVVGVQLRIRGDQNPLTATEMRDEAYDALHGLTGLLFGETWVVQLNWQSAAELGPDDVGRYERTENYWLSINRPHSRLE